MATIKDIAKVAGVSATAVSKIIRSQGSFAQDTRKRVLKIAKELNYRPNLSARSLVNRKSDIIGLIVPNGAAPFCGTMFTGAHKATLNTEYRLMMSAFYDVQSELEAAIQSLTDSGCENIILHALDVKDSYLIELAEKISGLVIIGRFLPVLQNRCVWMDNVFAGQLAGEYLLSKGHNNIVYVARSHVSVNANERLVGIQNAFASKGFTLPQEQICHISSSGASDDKNRQKILDALNVNPDISAVVAFNDKTASEVVHVARLNNLSIPDDISLIGFDDSLFCTVLSPKLTSIKYPIEEMAAYAVELSLKLTQKSTDSSSNTHLFMPTVVERESVAVK